MHAEAIEHGPANNVEHSPYAQAAFGDRFHAGLSRWEEAVDSDEDIELRRIEGGLAGAAGPLLEASSCSERDSSVRSDAEEGEAASESEDEGEHRRRPADPCTFQEFYHDEWAVQGAAVVDRGEDDAHGSVERAHLHCPRTWARVCNTVSAYDEELSDAQAIHRRPGHLAPQDDAAVQDLQVDVPQLAHSEAQATQDLGVDYRFRGPELCGCSLAVYAMCVEVRARERPTPGSCRTKELARVIHFARGHPQRGKFVQCLRSKVVCPLHAGPKPPRLPAPSAHSGEGASDGWLRRRQRAVEYMVDVFVPWDGPTPRPPTLDTLQQFLTRPSTSVVRPPQHLGSTMADDLTDQPELLPAFSLRLLRHHMQDIHVSHFFKQLNGQYRFRSRRLWTDLERAQYDQHVARAADGAGGAKTVDDLAAMHTARRYDQRRVAAACAAEAWAAELTCAFAATAAPAPADDAVATSAWSDYKDGVARWSTISPQELHEAHRRLCATTDAATLETAPGDIDHSVWAVRGPPTALDLDAVPTFPSSLALGPQQLAALSGMYKSVRLLAWHQKAGIARGASRQEYAAQASAQASDLGLPMQYFVQGAPGTGKTRMLRALQAWVHTENLGVVAFSAYTGVAVTGLPAPAATYCTFFGIGATVGAQGLVDVQSKHHTVFARILGGHTSRLTVLVLDEWSFLNVSQIAYLDKRLQQLLDCQEPFGGLVLLLVGDAHQLPSVGGQGLHTGLVEDALTPVQRAALGKRCGSSDRVQDTSAAPARGLALLRRVYRLPILSEQHRTDDPDHLRRLTQLRDTRPGGRPVSTHLINALQPLTREAVEREGDALRFAPIGVIGNRERHLLNERQARAFAVHHRRILFQWKLELTGQAAGWLSDAEKEELYEHEPGLWGRFVRGAPAIINHNVGTDRGLVNGARPLAAPTCGRIPTAPLGPLVLPSPKACCPPAHAARLATRTGRLLRRDVFHVPRPLVRHPVAGGGGHSQSSIARGRGGHLADGATLRQRHPRGWRAGQGTTPA